MTRNRHRTKDSPHCGPSFSLPKKLALERDKTGTVVNMTHNNVSKSLQIGYRR